MPADFKDLERRLAACTSSDTSRGVNFNSAFRVIRELGGEDVAKACDPAGTGTRHDFFAYPVADYLRIAWAAVDRFEKELGGADAVFFRLGERTILDHLSSVLGRTLFTIFGRDSRRMLANVPSSYRASVSYGDRSVHWLGERHARFVFKRDFLVPAFHCGIFKVGVEAMGDRAVNVTGRATGFLDAEYEVKWEAGE